MVVGKVRVAVVDDHELVVTAICAALEDDDEVEIVAATTSPNRLLALLAQTAPDVVLLDLAMPEMDGIACLDLLLERDPHLKVVILSGVEETRAVQQALRSGAAAFVRKTVDPRDIVAVIRQAVEDTVVSQSSLLLIDDEDDERAAVLTPSELAVLTLLARGLMNKQIAVELTLAQQTVKFHLTNVYRKLGVSNRTEAIRFAYEHGLAGEAKAYAYT